MNKLNLFKALSILIILAGVSACTEFDKLIKKEPPPAEQDLFEIKRLADAAYEDDNLAESEKHYTTLVREAPAEPTNWFRLGNIYARTKRPEAAIAAYREVLVRDPQFTKAWYNLGIVQLKQAAHSFTELQIYSEEYEPLHEQSRKLVEGILGILGNDTADGE